MKKTITKRPVTAVKVPARQAPAEASASAAPVNEATPAPGAGRSERHPRTGRPRG